MFKKILLPPLFPVVIFILLIVWMLCSYTFKEVHYIDGEIDDAPQRIAPILPFFTPFIYLVCAVINCIDYSFDVWLNHIRWQLTVLYIFVLGLSLVLFSHTGSFIGVLLLLSIIVVPMSLIRRLLLGRPSLINSNIQNSRSSPP